MRVCEGESAPTHSNYPIAPDLANALGYKETHHKEGFHEITPGFPHGRRRRFGAASIARVWAAKTTGTEFPFAEFEQRIARRDFRDITKDILPTPSHGRRSGHVPGQHQAHGGHGQGQRHQCAARTSRCTRAWMSPSTRSPMAPIGLTCATIAEAELFSGAGIKSVLWTKQPASINNIQRAVLLSKKDPTFMFVADDPQVVDWVEEAAAAHNAKLRIAVSVYAGMARQGIDGGQPARGTGAEGRFVQTHAVRRLHGLLGRRGAHQGI